MTGAPGVQKTGQNRARPIGAENSLRISELCGMHVAETLLNRQYDGS